MAAGRGARGPRPRTSSLRLKPRNVRLPASSASWVRSWPFAPETAGDGPAPSPSSPPESLSPTRGSATTCSPPRPAFPPASASESPARRHFLASISRFTSSCCAGAILVPSVRRINCVARARQTSRVHGRRRQQSPQSGQHCEPRGTHPHLLDLGGQGPVTLLRRRCCARCVCLLAGPAATGRRRHPCFPNRRLRPPRLPHCRELRSYRVRAAAASFARCGLRRGSWP